MAIKHNRDIVKVATMYYKKSLKQSEIAKRLGISRSLVSKYLNDAKNEGIVDIFIKSESAYSIELELALEETFGLKKPQCWIPAACERMKWNAYSFKQRLPPFKKKSQKPKRSDSLGEKC